MLMSLFQYITLLLVVPILIFIHNWRCNRNGLVPNWPIIGMLLNILHNLSNNLHDYVTLDLKHHGGTMWFKGPWLTNTNFILTSDAMNVHHITNKNSGNYWRRGSDFAEIFEVFGSGIINSNSNDWKQKKTVLHSFIKNKASEISLQLNIQKKVVNCLLPYLNHYACKSGAEVDLQDIFERLTFDTTCTFLFGFDPKCLPYNFTDQLPEVPYLKAISVIEEVILHRHYIPRGLWKLQKWLQVGQEKKNKVAQQNIHQFLHQCISYISKGGDQSEEADQCHNFGSTCMSCQSYRPLIEGIMKEESRNEKGDKYLRDTALGLLIAGNGTISACLSWLFWLVSTHPVVEAKILEEINDNLIITSSSVEGVDKLVYLHGAICEALRLYPPIPFEHICAIKSDILPSGDHVSPNTKLIYFLYAMGRMEKIWGEDSLEFKPERWISKRGDIIHVPSYKFIAFNTGPRGCLGKDISFLQMKMVASALLCSFEIRVDECHLVIPKVSLVLRMKHGLKVKVIERDVYEKVSTTNSTPNDEKV